MTRQTVNAAENEWTDWQFSVSRALLWSLAIHDLNVQSSLPLVHW